ncbi:hypothetical protein GCM10010272_09330 [Streptomyces lateritius]|nr:hypothetical protein GCM10010272_09330 [Streptomyces lateritius]
MEELSRNLSPELSTARGGAWGLAVCPSAPPEQGCPSQTGVNLALSYPQIFVSYPVLCTTLWISSGQGLTAAMGSGYFHCVETPNPAAMKPNPTTMFQLLRDFTGRLPSVT